MNTDERRCPDTLTERVIGAILEVSNVSGAGFLERCTNMPCFGKADYRSAAAYQAAPQKVATCGKLFTWKRKE